MSRDKQQKQQKLNEPHIACCVITKPPYSADLASSDSWMFHTLKISLKGEYFEAIENIKSNV
jgi:hypothetical protein